MTIIYVILPLCTLFCPIFFKLWVLSFLETFVVFMSLLLLFLCFCIRFLGTIADEEWGTFGGLLMWMVNDSFFIGFLYAFSLKEIEFCIFYLYLLPYFSAYLYLILLWDYSYSDWCWYSSIWSCLGILLNSIDIVDLLFLLWTRGLVLRYEDETFKFLSYLFVIFWLSHSL